MLSFTSDWLYPSYQSLEIVSALRSRNCDVAYCNLSSQYGHDAFLVEVKEQTELVRGFLASTLKERARRLRRDGLGVREIYGRSDYAIIGELIEPRHSCARFGLRRGRIAGLVEGEQESGRARRRNGQARACRRPSRAASRYTRGTWKARSRIIPISAFDYVILSQTLQQTQHPLKVLRSMLRIGKHAIVAFPNFAHWRVRLCASVERRRRRKPICFPTTGTIRRTSIS